MEPFTSKVSKISERVIFSDFRKYKRLSLYIQFFLPERKNDLRKTKELLQREKEKTHAAEIMTEECQDKLRQAEQERDYALSHQKKVEIPVMLLIFHGIQL